LPGVYVVKSGWIKIVRTSSRGRELLMSLCGPGDMFGPCCDPFDPGETRCQARSQTTARLLVMSLPDWKGLWVGDPDTARVISKALLKARRGCIDLAARLAFESVETRLIHLLDRLTQWSRRSEGPDVEIPRILSQGEMASAIGTAREVVTRLLSHLERRGLIKRRGRTIVIASRRSQL
jgi:CRP-like cAMP-binding protein